MNTEKLIEAIFVRRPLWKRTSKQYRHRDLKKQLWMEVAELTEATEDEVRRKWKGLNDIFRREHYKYLARKKQNSKTELPNWIYYRHLQFLGSHIGTRGLRRNEDDSSVVDDNYGEDNELEESDHQQYYDDGRAEEYGEYNLDSSYGLDELHPYESVQIKCEYDDTIVQETTVADAEYYEKPSTNKHRKSKEKTTNDAFVGRNKQDESFRVTKRRKGSAEDNFVFFENTNHVTDDALKNSNVASDSSSTKATQTNADVSQPLHATETRTTLMLQRAADDVANDDFHFAMSLVPTMRELPTQRKMLLRMKIQQLLCEEVDLQQTEAAM